MREIMGKFVQKLSIKSRRDWFIAFVFAFLFIYLIVLRYQVVINDFLLPLTPDRISFFNQPENHGVYAITVLAMSALTMGVMIYKKVRGKYIALVLAGGIMLAGAVMGSYYYECRVMLKIPSEYQPEGVSVYYYGLDSSHEGYTLNEETEKQLVDKVVALEPLSEEEEKEQKERIDIDGSSGETSISIWYPRKHGHSYHLWVRVKDDVIRITKGHSPKDDPLYQDNGLLDILEKIQKGQD